MAALPEGGCVAVAFFVVGHFDEGVVGYGAREGYAGFDAPVVFVREEGGVIVEEAVGLLSVLCAKCVCEIWAGRCDVPRLKAAHVVVALLSSVLYTPAFHILHALLRAVLIDPFGIPPHLLGYNFELDVCAFSDCLAHLPLKVFSPFFVIKEHPGIPKVVVELLLDASHARDCTLDFRVAREHHEDGGFARSCV